MKKLQSWIVLLTTLLFATSLWANIATYYGNWDKKFSELDPQSLKHILHSILGNAHLHQDGVADIILEQNYCSKVMGENCYRHTLVSERSPYKAAKKLLYQYVSPMELAPGSFAIKPIYLQNTLITQTSPNNDFIRVIKRHQLNCEHIWPRSRFSSDKKSGLYRYQVSDLHILYPSKTHVNQIRSNYRFAENIPVTSNSRVRQDTLDEWNSKLMGNQLGQAVLGEAHKHDLFFMPIENSRGRVARAMLYFSIRYKRPIDSVDEYYLRKWHQEYSVTREEQIRNERIFSIQKVRNPFVDFPELVSQIRDF